MLSQFAISTLREGRARKAAGKALAVFLVGMTVLTLVNQALNNLSTAVVSKVNPQRGALEVRIDASGQLTAAESHAVYAKSALPVERVWARSGARVQAGDRLFALDMTELTDALNAARVELETLLREREKAAGTPEGEAPDESDLQDAEAEYDLAAARYEQALEDAWIDTRAERLQAMIDAEHTLAEKQRDHDWAKADMYKDALDDYDDSQADVDKAQARVEEAEAELARRIAEGETDARIKNARNTLTYRQGVLETEIRERDQRKSIRDYFGKRQALEQAQIAYDDAVAAYDAVTLPTEKGTREVEHSVASERSAMESALKARDEKRRTIRERKLDAESKDAEIRKKREEVALLQAQFDASGIVYAPIDAEVVTVSVAEGKTAEPAQAAVMLKPLNAPFELRATLSEDDAGEMSVGELCEISLSDQTMDQPITAISASEENPGKFDVCFQFQSGIGRVGMNAKIEYRRRSQLYDALVPLSALRQDNTGYFVYAIVTKDGALGAETVVERRDVAVIEQDSTRVAVSGNLSARDDLVARSDRALEAGDRVRIEGQS